MMLRAKNTDMDEVELRIARMRKLRKYFRIITPLFFLPLLVFVLGVVTGGITGTNNIVNFGFQSVSFVVFGIVIHFALNRELRKAGDLPPEIIRNRMEIFKPIRMQVLLGLIIIAGVELFILIEIPGTMGLVYAIISTFILTSFMALYIKRSTNLPWKEILLGKIE